MEARATTGKRARVLRFLRAAARHVLIDLLLLELVAAALLIARLPLPVRPVRLDAADFATLTITQTAGAWPSQSLTLDGQEEIAAYCEQLNALRAPRERHPMRYRTLGGLIYEFVFAREDGSTVTAGITSGTPLFYVTASPDVETQAYHVGEDVVNALCADVEALLHPGLGLE